MHVVSRLSLVTLLSACAASPPNIDANRSKTVVELKNLLTQCDERIARFNQATSEQRETCELSAGDCRMLVNEKRARFLQNQNTTACRNPDPDTEARCLADALMKDGPLPLAEEYYTAHLWCLDRILECLAASHEKAQSDSIAAQVEARRQAIEQSETGITERARAPLAEEKIKYLRATLPPNAEDECTEARPKDSCLEAAKSKESAYEAEFNKAEQDYQPKTAAKIHDEMTAAAAACYAPELTCLSTRLNKYGETNETRSLVEKNFQLLEQREWLAVKLGPAFAQPCLEQSTATHQPEIVRAYVAYVREPVLFFRMQLHRVFRTLHQAELDCLKQ